MLPADSGKVTGERHSPALGGTDEYLLVTQRSLCIIFS